MQFLFDYKTTSTGGLKVGLLLLAVAVLSVAALWRGMDKRIQRGAGIAAIAIPALYVLQLQRLVSAAEGASLTDIVGFGVLPALVGGVLITFAPQLATYKRRA
jgi:phosphatidylserine synthase